MQGLCASKQRRHKVVTGWGYFVTPGARGVPSVCMCAWANSLNGSLGVTGWIMLSSLALAPSASRDTAVPRLQLQLGLLPGDPR